MVRKMYTVSPRASFRTETKTGKIGILLVFACRCQTKALKVVELAHKERAHAHSAKQHNKKHFQKLNSRKVYRNMSNSKADRNAIKN